MMCDSTHRVLTTREAHPRLDIQTFYWDSVTQIQLIPYVADLPSPVNLELELLLHGLKSPP